MKLQAYLDKHGESQNAFAARAGIPQSTLCALANGKGTPTLENAVKIVSASNGMVAFGDLLPSEQAGRARGGKR